jgi:hypothetical protein
MKMQILRLELAWQKIEKRSGFWDSRELKFQRGHWQSGGDVTGAAISGAVTTETLRPSLG